MVSSRIPFRPLAAGASTRLRPAAGGARWERLAFGMLCLMVFAVPWGDMILLPWDVQASRVFSLLTLAVWLAGLRRGGRLRRLEAPHWWMLAFVIWAGVNLFETPEPERSLRRILSYYQLFLMAWLVHQAARNEERYDRLLSAYVLGCYVCAAGVLYHFLRGVSSGDGRISAPGFDPNDLAATLILGIPAAWHLAFRRGRGVWRHGLYVPFAAAGVLLTASRSGLLALGLACLFALINLPRISVRTIAVLSMAAAIGVGALSYLWDGILFSRLGTIQHQVAARDLNGRVDIWARGLEAVREHPLVGAGAGAFGLAVGARRSREVAAHNTFLGVAVEHGFVGLALLLGVLVCCLHRAWKAGGAEGRLWIFVLAVWLLIANTLSWENRELTWLLLGLIAASPYLARRAVRRPGMARLRIRYAV